MVVALALVILANSFREMELNMTIATARDAGEQIALENGVRLLKIDYTVAADNSVTVTPRFSDADTDRDSRIFRIATQVLYVVAPNSALFQNRGEQCFTTTRNICFN